jgi:hypothetical protein
MFVFVREFLKLLEYLETVILNGFNTSDDDELKESIIPIRRDQYEFA